MAHDAAWIVLQSLEPVNEANADWLFYVASLGLWRDDSRGHAYQTEALLSRYFETSPEDGRFRSYALFAYEQVLELRRR